MSKADENIYQFGEYRLVAEKSLLFKETEIVALAPKAVEVLLSLVEKEGEVISKDELLNRVWADSFVEEANLTHHISALRKALGEDKNSRKFIETIPRRGYRFVAPVREQENGATEIIVSEQMTARFVEEIEIETSVADETETIGELERKQISFAALEGKQILRAAPLSIYRGGGRFDGGFNLLRGF